MTYVTSFLLGLVQGVAEFLPISSSGHLAIAQNLLGLEGAGSVPEFFDVLLHLGTLIAVFAAYWKDICDMVVEFFRGIGDLKVTLYSTFMNMLGRVVAVFVMLRLLHMDFASLAWANMIGWIVMLLFEIPLLVKSLRNGECG